MNCNYCQTTNSENDHRCRRCGRRLTGSAVSAPPEYRSPESFAQAQGATALAMKKSRKETAEIETNAAGTAERMKKPAQPSLFADEFAPRVIPFDAQQRESLLKTARNKRPVDGALEETSEFAPPRRPSVKVPTRKQIVSDPRGEQSTLDFLPAAPVQASRTLKTTVEAVIYCDAAAASPLHRALAALLDLSMISLGLGIFLAVFEVFGGPFAWTKQNIIVWLAVVGLISMFYGFIWALCGRESPGKDWTDLHVINFNGFPPDGKSRALRLVGCWLSFCSGTIGIFWALMDEEGLTWHDHMSKTFPTVRENHTTLVRQRPR
jgi:uncharacterized RDD family membrane protein YckC